MIVLRRVGPNNVGEEKCNLKWFVLTFIKILCRFLEATYSCFYETPYNINSVFMFTVIVSLEQGKKTFLIENASNIYTIYGI